MRELSYTYPTEKLSSGGVYANPTVIAHSDRASNLTCLWNSLVAAPYCKNVRFSFRTYELGRPGDRLEPMVTIFYPTYQETIFGTEGVIVAQRVFVPYRAGYSEAVCWQLDLQTEGHRLLQIGVEIDWGGGETAIPLEQFYRDGLIVVKGGPSRGATRVFGANGPPTLHEFSAGGNTQLIYHVLIEGYIDLPFMLTMAPSGEQLAWNGFLALSDLGLVFQDSNRQMNDILETAELLSPVPAFNRGLAWAKTQLMKGVRRGRMGIAFNPDSGRDICVTTSATAAHALAWWDAEESVEILAKLRARAQTPEGGIAAHYDHYSGEQTAPPDVEATAAYLSALRRHLLRGTDDGDLQASAQAASAWLESQPQSLPLPNPDPDPNLAKTLSEMWDARERQPPGVTETTPGAFDSIYRTLRDDGHPIPEVQGKAQQTLTAAASYLILALETVAGLTPVDDQTLLFHPTLPSDWSWLTILDLPYGGRNLNCIYHDGMIYTVEGITSPLPLTRCHEITRLPYDRIALTVRDGDGNHLFVANPEETRWSGQVRAFDQVFSFELEPGEARWLETKP